MNYAINHDLEDELAARDADIKDLEVHIENLMEQSDHDTAFIQEQHNYIIWLEAQLPNARNTYAALTIIKGGPL